MKPSCLPACSAYPIPNPTSSSQTPTNTPEPPAKHFLTDPTHLVTTALHSLTLTNPSLALDANQKVVYLRPSARLPTQTVSLLSGGGSGHEPAFGAYVGRGLLDAAVAGTIFASPGKEQVRAGIERCFDDDGKKEKEGRAVLVVVMNYTGDILNFGLGVEKAKAAGHKVEMVVVGDDVGVGRTRSGKVGRRGIAGTVLVVKVAGALAATGASLEEVGGVARRVAGNLVSVGASLTRVHVPGRSGPPDPEVDEVLATEEVEVGMGIHNEPGSHRATVDLVELVKTLLAQLLDWRDEDRAFLNVRKEDEVVLLVNNLGGVSVLEMGGITAEVVSQLAKDYSIKPVRILSGTYMTSLNGLGFSITLLKLADTGLGPGKSMLELLDAPTEATGWSAAVRTETWGSEFGPARDTTGSAGDGTKPSNLRST